MIRINLLPHREQKRAARRKQFAILASVAITLGAGVVFAGSSIISNRIEGQIARNNFLQGEVDTLDKQIKEIETLKTEKQALLDRKLVVEKLQANRSETVHILDQLARQTPEGIYLKGIKQEGEKLILTGYAQSNARVSTLMRNLDASPTFDSPNLIEIKAITLNNLRLSEFNLAARITRSNQEGEDGITNKDKKNKGQAK